MSLNNGKGMRGAKPPTAYIITKSRYLAPSEPLICGRACMKESMT